MTLAPLQSNLMSYQSDSNNEFRTGRQTEVIFPSGRVYLTCGLLSLKLNYLGLAN